MRDLPAIRYALADQLAARLGVGVYPYPPGTPRPPCGVLHTDPAVYVEPHEAHVRGLMTVHYVLELLVGAVDDPNAHEQLDMWIGPVVDTIEPENDSQTLGGLVSHCTLERISGVTARDVGPVRYLGATVDIAVRRPITT